MRQTINAIGAQRRKRATEIKGGPMQDVASDQILERWVEFKDWKINLRCNLCFNTYMLEFQRLFLIHVQG